LCNVTLQALREVFNCNIEVFSTDAATDAAAAAAKRKDLGLHTGSQFYDLQYMESVCKNGKWT
jgi:hypothetical protein